MVGSTPHLGVAMLIGTGGGRKLRIDVKRHGTARRAYRASASEQARQLPNRAILFDAAAAAAAAPISGGEWQAVALRAGARIAEGIRIEPLPTCEDNEPLRDMRGEIDETQL